MSLRTVERALVELNTPQIPYEVQGGYGAAGATIATALVSILPSVITGRQGKKAAEEQAALDYQMSREQSLINAQLAQNAAYRADQHAKNMPLYLLVGIGGLTVLGLVLKGKK